MVLNQLEKRFLKRISLIDAHINHDIMHKYFCNFIVSSKYLEEINISDNKLMPKSFIRFFEVLASNKSIKYLNLSWNCLLEDSK